MGGLAHRRHDISDRTWEIVKDRLPGREGIGGGRARDNRLCLDAVCWMLRTGASWRDVPPDDGDWKNTHRRFCRWRDKGIGEKCENRWVPNRMMLFSPRYKLDIDT